jgi:hypothetical protein
MTWSRLQRAFQASQKDLRSCVVEDPSSPTGYGILDFRGKHVSPLQLDSYQGPGFKIDAAGKVYLDRG